MSRKIILLSDGTGNSSAKIWRTNVWRTFEALDLSGSDQVAFYDDGVGTSSFKPWAILTGAFGFGLKRNVIDIYKFTCRNYRNPTDEIFGFGFSRGAFTIRVVVGLILDQGLVAAQEINESELDRLARLAYRRYHRRHFHTNWRRLLHAIQSFGFNAQREQTVVVNAPCIRFLGLWDTVAAYGLPIDEMTRGFSQWIWPLEIPNHTLHPSVIRACHALSLDDERTTFHPVLWNERQQAALNTSDPRYTKDERISQVWFAGTHANVGGGYPDDSLARISLYWIMEEARSCGLKFKQPPAADPDALAQIKSAQDKDGRLYNSRNGFASYYRYGPRKVAKLCDQQFSLDLGRFLKEWWFRTGRDVVWSRLRELFDRHLANAKTVDEVHIDCQKIHESVLKRIDNNAHLYAPIGLPGHYELVTNVVLNNHVLFEILPPNNNPYEKPEDAQARSNSQEAALWDLVSIRALLYFLTVFVTFAFVIFPISGRPNPIAELSNPFRWVSDIIRLFGTILPESAQRWIDGYAQNPRTFLLFIVTLFVLTSLGTRVATRISNKMSGFWRESLQHRLVDPGRPTSWAYIFREWLFEPVSRFWKFVLGPVLSALLIVYVVVAFGGHLLFNIQDVAGFTCRVSETTREVPEQGALINFHASELCHPTTLKLASPGRYLVWVNPDPVKLAEHTGYVSLPSVCEPNHSPVLRNGAVTTTPAGYSTFHNDEGQELSWTQTVRHFFRTPLRRELDRPWFQMVARYGSLGGEETFLDPDPNRQVKVISETIRPTVSGELFLFVNDAVIGIPGLYGKFYHDNEGCIGVFIQPR